MNLAENTVRRTLAQAIADQMGREILAGELPAGRRMVAEEVEKRYAVSRTAVREALTVLASKGLLASRPNIGILINPSDKWHLLDQDVLAWAPRDGWLAAGARSLHARITADVDTCTDYIAGDPLIKQLVDMLAAFVPNEDDLDGAAIDQALAERAAGADPVAFEDLQEELGL